MTEHQPETDDEPWNLDVDELDGLAPARGCLLSIVIGLAFWALLIAVIAIVWRLR